MSRRNNKKLNLKGKSLLVAPEHGLLNETDSDNSVMSNDQVFKSQTLVMDMHGTQRDELPDNPLPEHVQVKTRKLLKKKRTRPDPAQPGQDPSAGSLTSSSESSVVPPAPEKQEEFFDAHESYYNIQDQASTTPNASIPTNPPLPVTVTSKQPVNPEALRLATPQNSPQDKRAPETTVVAAAPEVAPVATTQDTATGQTPLTSAKPIRPSNPE
ncbi:mediator of DNA damage checkpoint protein 1-like isoform X2 [Leguminivora glycinivorella]|uniref:mediator of DNA damage checkpoint protein 1-like isoform X2 n=1 Tax=Leguminivora glycinivorella TaxID=1035111 RepID=UPI00200CAC0B|nr:mediator of DNA damage checkpoint protein 1-like isoform X2 [Leguminivora glycinivorella]